MTGAERRDAKKKDRLVFLSPLSVEEQAERTGWGIEEVKRIRKKFNLDAPPVLPPARARGMDLSMVHGVKWSGQPVMELGHSDDAV